MRGSPGGDTCWVACCRAGTQPQSDLGHPSIQPDDVISSIAVLPEVVNRFRECQFQERRTTSSTPRVPPAGWMSFTPSDPRALTPSHLELVVSRSAFSATRAPAKMFSSP